MTVNVGSYEVTFTDSVPPDVKKHYSANADFTLNLVNEFSYPQFSLRHWQRFVPVGWIAFRCLGDNRWQIDYTPDA